MPRHYLGKNMQIIVVHKLNICLQCYAAGAAKKEIESKDHTGMCKQEGSLQNGLVVRPIKTVYLKRTLFIEEQP